MQKLNKDGVYRVRQPGLYHGAISSLAVCSQDFPLLHFSQLLQESNTYSQGHCQHIKSHGTISIVLCI